jgi:DNA-binding GntR family transcriptional regulator
LHFKFKTHKITFKTQDGAKMHPIRPAEIAKSSPSLTMTDPPLSSVIHRENLDDKIYKQLRSLILERRILPGERVPVDRLAREMGVSRTPIVNALKRLAQEQVVDWHSHTGVYVRTLSKRELARLFEVREVLEGLAARRAAERISLAEVDELTAMFKVLDLSTIGPALQTYIEKDRYFHLRLLELAENASLTHAVNAVHLMVFTYQLGISRPPAETIKEHWAILAALRKQDPDASEAAMRLHLRRSRERYDQEADEEEARLPHAAEGASRQRKHSQRAGTLTSDAARGSRRQLHKGDK